MKKTFGVIGGDRRQAVLAALLRAEGHPVRTYGVGESPDALEAAAAAEIVILPLPLCREAGVLNCEGAHIPTGGLFARFRPDQLLLAGQVQPAQRQEAEAHGLTLVDYFQREELTVANAAVTAEAAIQTALDRLDRTLLGMDCLVLGFGRIGKLLSLRLQGLGARAAAAARKPEDRAWIRAYGLSALDTGRLAGRLNGFPVVFNTVPALLLNRPLLEELPEGSLIVDLASVPGADQAAAEELGLSYLQARALPGRVKPAAGAEAIFDTVHTILKERGDLM